MDQTDPVWHSARLRDAIAQGDTGRIVKIFRVAEGLTLQQLGRRVHLSASSLSRLEHGGQSVRDVAVLSALARALDIPPCVLGLADAPSGSSRSTAFAATVKRDDRREDADEVRRRELLAGIAGTATAAALPSKPAATGLPAGAFVRELHEVLHCANPDAGPATLSELHQALGRARTDFHGCRYRELAARLPALISTADATRREVSLVQRSQAEAVLAGTYNLTTRLLIKIGDDAAAAVTADRALSHARAGSDPAQVGEASRMVSSVLRRTGHTASAQQVVERAAAQLTADMEPSSSHCATLAYLLCTAAYTAAQDGDRAHALDLLAEADEAAARLPEPARREYLASGSPVNVLLHRVSVSYLLGDAGAAIDAARHLDPAAIALTERRARYWTDLARAYYQWGKDEACYRSLVAAYRAAPEDVRGRPAIRALVTDLVARDRRRSPELRRFATSIGAV